ncbi:disease resistance protein RUN1-like [Lotus japonicus]|uniref:disease resistance protein RUN1-like n=1 Tax=Lotus japonicus TaxID=34305 RepID=UPI0025845082|nr:disease resistance protein RUN1-like [Lotus japonicus]
MECQKTHGQLVIPIFYNVDPSEVRRLGGAFTLGRGDMPLLMRWLIALNQVANLAGWHLRVLRTEAEAVKQIVDDVLTKLEITFLSVTEFPVGLESRVQEVIEFIESQTSREGCVVGIWGMEDRSFIENIREVCENDSRGHIHLQEQLLSNVLKTKVEKIISIATGAAMIKKRLLGKRALVILDDVTTNEQLKALCGNGKWFGQGSVIIVTTRDVRLLNFLKADYVCSVKEMDQKESLELLSWHAFGEANPREDLIELSRNVVAYCGGLPLALEVLGTYLNERTEQEWKSVLSRLERFPNHQVQERLKTSYDCLSNHLEKDIFLDICCFFIGKDRAYVTHILNACGLYADIGITVLTERSLIKVDKKNKLRMHNLVRDMGREIVRESSEKEPGKRNRLWFHKDMHDVLPKNTGAETVEGLAFQRTNRVSFNTNAFKEMKKLRLLQLDGVDLTRDYEYLSKELRWISWQGFTFKYIPNDFHQGNLVVLELKYSSIKHVWKETKLILKDCPSLVELHRSIGELRNILLINLKDCTSLSNLPMKIYQLKSLKTLILCGCSKIDKLEEDIVQVESLKKSLLQKMSV